MEMTAKELYLFKECPLKYHFKVNQKETVEMSRHDKAKEALQATIRFFYFHMIQEKEIEYDQLKKKFSSVFYKNSSGFDITEPKKPNERERDMKYIDMLHKFFMSQKYTPDLVKESQLEYRIPFGHDFFVKGTIPVIRVGQEGEEIVHHSLSSKKPTDFWLETDMDLTLQAMAYHSIFGEPVDKIIIRHLPSGEVYETRRTKDQYKRVYKTIKMMKKSIENEWFFPRESPLCNTCMVQDLCMKWR